MATGPGNSNDPYRYAGYYSSLGGVSSPASKESSMRYTTLEGSKTPGMRESGSQDYLRRAKSNIAPQTIGNFLQAKEKTSNNQSFPFSQTSHSSFSVPSGNYQNDGGYSGSTFSTGQTDKLASNPRQVKPQKQNSNSVTSGSGADNSKATKNRAVSSEKAETSTGKGKIAAGSSVKAEGDEQAEKKPHQPRTLFDIEQQTIKLANGLMELWQKVGWDKYEEYLKLAVTYMTDVDCFSEQYEKNPKKAKIKDTDFAELFKLQRLFKKRGDQPFVNTEQFNKRREALDQSSKDYVEKLIDLIGDLGTTESILNQYRTGFTSEMKTKIQRALYRNAIERTSHQIWGCEGGTKKSMMGSGAAKSRETEDQVGEDLKSSGTFHFKPLDDLHISRECFSVMKNYVKIKLIKVDGYSKISGLLKKKDADNINWTTSEVKDLFTDLSTVAKYHLVKPSYKAQTGQFKTPSISSGDKEIKSALRRYLRDGNYQFTDDDVLAETSAYSHQVRYADPDKGGVKIHKHIHELQTIYYDPDRGKAEALLEFDRMPDAMKTNIRNKVIEKFVDSLFVVRDEVTKREAREQSGDETANKSIVPAGAGNAMQTLPFRGAKMNIVSSMMPKTVLKVSKAAGAVIHKVTDVSKREEQLSQRFIKDSALRKVRCFINDMAEFQAAKI